jgi:CRP-like cAMP-binding protein
LRYINGRQKRHRFSANTRQFSVDKVIAFDEDQKSQSAGAHYMFTGSISQETTMDAMRHQPVSTLPKAAIFSQLSAPTLERLAEGTTELILRRNSVVFDRGATATGIYVVSSGQLKLSLEMPQGTEHVVELLHEGDSFGEAALLTNLPHLVTATAVTASSLLHIARQALMSGLERDPELARRIIKRLSDRLYHQTGALENVLFLKASGRVARYILDQLTTDDAGVDRRVALPVRKGLIASHLNMTQEHFSRTLHELTVTGLIRVEGGTVDILEMDKLRDAAGRVFALGHSRAAA